MRTVDDFISDASHELKTPVTIIRGFAEMLVDHPNLPPEQHKEIAQKLVRTSHRLERLIHSLTLLTELDQLPQDRLQLIDLVAVAEESGRFLLSVCPEAHLSLQSEVPSLPVLADAGLLELALINVLENAVKYSQVPAQIQVKVEQTETEVKIQVKDQGIGISEEEIGHIFERFYRVDKGRSRQLGGMGLGLSIVQRAMEKQGGKVEVESVVGQGSIFTLILSNNYR